MGTKLEMMEIIGTQLNDGNSWAQLNDGNSWAQLNDGNCCTIK